MNIFKKKAAAEEPPPGGALWAHVKARWTEAAVPEEERVALIQAPKVDLQGGLDCLAEVLVPA